MNLDNPALALHETLSAITPAFVGVHLASLADKSTWTIDYSTAPTKDEAVAVAAAIDAFVFAPAVQRDLAAELDELKARMVKTDANVTKVAAAAGVDIAADVEPVIGPAVKV